MKRIFTSYGEGKRINHLSFDGFHGWDIGSIDPTSGCRLRCTSTGASFRVADTPKPKRTLITLMPISLPVC